MSQILMTAKYVPHPVTEGSGTCRRLEPRPIGVYFNFARHTHEPYRKMGSPIGHVWWLLANERSGNQLCQRNLQDLANKIYLVCYKPFGR